MMFQPTKGALVSFRGRALLYHSGTAGYVQFEELETGAIRRWNRGKFKNEISAGRIRPLPTVASNAETQVILSRFQAGRALAYRAFQASQLSLRKGKAASLISG
ncbi:hypothetical protein VAR608DRAFT_1317 [Variovorax sp. HW608]|nr:hypothetical protein VAR608DRAFT_1317 [Variovorax sp. HW608]